jgi:hypothetical protein
MAEVSRRAAADAEAAGLDTIVSSSRTLLADLYYSLRDSGLTIYAEPAEGFPPHHYAQAHPLPPGEGEVLYLSRGGEPPCAQAVELDRWQPELGFYTGEIATFRAPRGCFFAPR